MFDRPKSGERTVLVEGSPVSDPEAIAELKALSLSAGAEPVAVLTGRRATPDPRFFIGKGKVDELRQAIADNQAELVIFNQPLSPSQERNLERELNVRVLDRIGLILDIFAQRAQSFEGKLQVELAQLRHLSTRLVRGWTHLERQKGGIGLRGPGETQLETDKRLIGRRISQIQKRLEKVERQRGQGQRARRRAEIPVVGLVGYTNAGKSTLMNALTGSSVYAADQLFATLDPTLKRLSLNSSDTVILVDTVGFVRDLPHELVAAFRSTLQETAQADLLLHVVDVTDERMAATIEEVNRVIEEIGAGETPQVLVLNKIDRLEDGQAHCERDESGQIGRIWLSAQTGEGLGQIAEALLERFGRSTIRQTMHLGPGDGAIRAALYRMASIIGDQPDESGGWLVEFESSQDVARLVEGMTAGSHGRTAGEISP